MICPKCHSANREGAKFCDECGASLSFSADKTVSLASGSGEGEDISARDGESAPEQGMSAEEIAEEAELDDFTDVDEEIADGVGFGAKAGDLSASEDDSGELEGASSSVQKTSALDPARVPSIDVVGVNVDDAGHHFTFGGDVVEGERSSDKTQVIAIDSAKTADLSGLERLVDSSYVPPSPSWRSGDTMELPVIEGAPKPKQKEFKAPDADAERKRSRRKRIAVSVVVVVAVALAAIGITYSMELWGGKTVPDVTGEAQADAAWMLESKGFSVNATQVKSDEVEGIVLITDPAGGSRVAPGTTVNVSIATPRVVPDIMGISQEDAQKALDKEGLENVAFTTQKSNEPEGTVIALSIDSGTKVKAATALTVTIAESYVVPDVVGESQDDAQAALEDAGYSVSVKTEYSEDVAEGTVISTDPVAGAKLNSESTVTLVVAKSRAKEVVSATESFFSKGATVYVGGVSYEVSSCEGVTYEGNGTASYTVTARKFESVSTLLFGNKTLYGDVETLTGTITWASDGSITASSPRLSK